MVRETIKSIISFSMAVPLFGVRQISQMLSGGKEDLQDSSTTSALDTVARATEDQLGDRMHGLYKGGDTIQRSVVDLIFNTVSSEAESGAAGRVMTDDDAPPPVSVKNGKLDVKTFVVLGEGLAAGMGDFGLSEESQVTSFSALLARQFGAEFNQPLLEAPGLGDLPGFPKLPVRVPALLQTTGLSEFPPSRAIHNLSIPGYHLEDALQRRPIEPLIHRSDAKQTLTNMTLGMPDLVHEGDGPLMTQLEYALRWHPTVSVVELGYHEMIEAAVAQDPNALPNLKAFRENFGRVLSELRASGSELVVMTIPDPGDTAYFSSIESAASLLKVKPSALMAAYNLDQGDRISVDGLMEMGCHLIAGEARRLPDGSVIPGAWIEQVRNHVSAMNKDILALTQEHTAVSYDLHGLFRRVQEIGISLGSRRLTSDFLGGFYQLNGYYPGATGQALIANDVLRLLNSVYDAEFTPVDLGLVIARDPVADYRRAEGPVLASEDLFGPNPTQGSQSDFAVSHGSSEPTVDVKTESDSSEGNGAILDDFKSELPLTLPKSMEQVLPIDKEASFYGDAIRAVNCRDEKEAVWGSGRELLFGGLAMVDSHLQGRIRIKYSHPVDDVTHFEVSHEGGMNGDNGILKAPQFFKLPACHNSVKDDPELVSSGKLNLTTGEVTDLEIHYRFMNTALLSLVRANPKFPDVPISFPGKYGSAWARFEQRSDGNLDFTFFGTTFVPLGMVLKEKARFPLPFCSPTLQYATIPAHGMQLHPHIHLSTKPPESAGTGIAPEIPTNTIREYTTYAHNTSFGDKFSLNMSELGGEATGRSQLLGRVEVQFGERFGDSVSVAVTCFSPGGILSSPNPPPSLLTESFPGRLFGGLQGHNETLRFPKLSYALTNVYCLDDPFDLSVGAINLKSGRLLNELLHRGLIGQDLFFALLEVEPRTPKESFQFRGPALFESDDKGQLVFRFKGQVTIPYPETFLFPAPDLKNGFAAGPGSILDPFLWIQAVDEGEEIPCTKKGSKENVTSSNGEQFSYKYNVSNQLGSQAAFEYVNHAQDATFTMHRLTWVGFMNSRSSTLKTGNYDTLSFTGFGSWSKDEESVARLVNVQVSTSRQTPYVSIQVDGGFTSNVNTKPAEIDAVRP